MISLMLRINVINDSYLEVISMKINNFTFSTDELASDVALVECLCQIAYRRKNDGRLD